MDCSYINKNLFAIFENTISPAEHSEIDLHINSCSECSRVVHKFRETMQLIAKDKSKEINPFMNTRILQRIESVRAHHAERKQKVLIHVLQPVAFAFSLLLAVLIGFSLGKSSMNVGSDKTSAEQNLQSLRSELFISDIMDEDKTLFLNP